MAKDLIILTKEELVNAFHEWNQSIAHSPEDYKPADPTIECAKDQAIALMNNVDKVAMQIQLSLLEHSNVQEFINYCKKNTGATFDADGLFKDFINYKK